MSRLHGAAAAGDAGDRRETVRKVLVGCGVAGPLVYLVANLVAPALWPGYSPTSQAVSELAAVDAPSRTFFVTLSIVSGVLGIAFGAGVWLSAGPGERAMRATGALLAVGAAVGLPLQPFFPMHMRGVERDVSDTMHLVLVGLSTPLTLVAMGFSAATSGKWFRVYSIVSLVAVFVFGMLSGMDAPRIDAGEPTPWVGTNERISFAAYYLWSVVFAVALLRRHVPPEEARPADVLVPGVAPGQ